MTEARPAFYALAPGGWRDYVTLLHPPYTAWHLSYVVIGACLAPHLYEGRLAAALVAFFLALGISAHALLDHQRAVAPLTPKEKEAYLQTIDAPQRRILMDANVAFNGWLLVFVAIGLVLVPVYNLELFGGAIHNSAGFALAWGAFPLLTGYFACAGTISWTALLAAAYATLTSYVQRVLSTPVRDLRRRVAAVSGTIELRDGGREPVTRETLAAAPERALQALAAANVALAAALLVLRLA